jgi:hypothetical protein
MPVTALPQPAIAGTRAAVGSRHGREVEPVDDFHHEARQVAFGQPFATEGGSGNPVVRSIGRKLLMADSLAMENVL